MYLSNKKLMTDVYVCCVAAQANNIFHKATEKWEFDSSLKWKFLCFYTFYVHFIHFFFRKNNTIYQVYKYGLVCTDFHHYHDHHNAERIQNLVPWFLALNVYQQKEEVLHFSGMILKCFFAFIKCTTIKCISHCVHVYFYVSLEKAGWTSPTSIKNMLGGYCSE